jgi:UDP-N-acetylmuramoyl-tripeptide--D-alanyl-D-alanine ligase
MLMPFLLVVTLVGVGAWLAALALQARRLLHVLQLEEYEVRRFWAWLAADRERVVPRRQLHAMLALAGLATAMLAVPSVDLFVLVGPLALAASIYAWRGRPRADAKKPLTWTKKALLLAAVAGALVALTLAIAVRLWLLPTASPPQPALFVATLAVLGLLPAHYLTLATLMVYPFQAAAKAAVVALAARRLRAREDLIVVGITGSYGKTSTKEFLATLLVPRYRVLRTAASVNTPVGIARTVLRELRPEHQVFVVEMGAYVRGNIRDLAHLARPRIGVLTAVGEQHLERFGSVEQVAVTKYELIEALPADGLAVFNADNKRCRDLARRTSAVPVRTYGLERRANGPALLATDVETGLEGTCFTVHAPGSDPVHFQIPLLGRHNVGNVLAATAVALELGLSLAEIAAAARNLEPVPHRLQLLRGGAGVTVIDDAYNSNPAGAQTALEVLAEFPGRKVLVTPGMVELGPLLERRHEEFGRQAAGVCDYIILVGPRRTAAVAAGAAAAGFAPDRLIVVPTLKEATARLGQLVAAGDVVLFENDLPDQYSEQ